MPSLLSFGASFCRLSENGHRIYPEEVESALNDLEEARARADRYTKEAAIAKQLSVKAAIAFEGGLGGARELLEDTLLYARGDGERLKALFDAQIARAALEKAVGGF